MPKTTDAERELLRSVAVSAQANSTPTYHEPVPVLPELLLGLLEDAAPAVDVDALEATARRLAETQFPETEWSTRAVILTLREAYIAGFLAAHQRDLR